MIKRLSIFFVLCMMIIGFSNALTARADEVKSKTNAMRVFGNSIVNLDKFDDFWTPKNEQYLSESQRQELNKLKEKSSNGEILTTTDNNNLKKMKSEVIKIKLGDSKFDELQKLIDKREGSTELTLEERARLYQLNKEAKA